MTARVRDTRGFSLAELLVVCAILGFIMAGLFALQRQGQLAYLTGSARVEVQQNARFALDMMISDIRTALPQPGGGTTMLAAIDVNCQNGPAPTNGGGTSIRFLDENNVDTTYAIAAAGVGDCTAASAPCLQKNLVTVIGGVQQLQIWCYNSLGNLDSTLGNVREVRVQIRTKTERGATAGTAGDQHAVAESRVRFRNI